MKSCWCGNAEMEYFSPGYLKCNVCQTLITKHSPETDLARVSKDEQDFYGSEYWFSHQEKDLGQPNVVTRARTDLPERCLHWLKTLLKYKLPPSKVLELGSAHGGFVAMLRLAGFDATGLELSPWIVDFARKTFDVPMLLGPIEDQEIEAGSLDAIALMDVLEHLPDPTATMKHCLSLLKHDGILLIQTPCFPTDKSYEQMKKNDDSFLPQLKENEHLFLFSKQSLKELFHRLGVEYIEFEPAIFFHYDMFLVVSRKPMNKFDAKEVEQSLISTTKGRFAQALLDLGEEIGALQKKYEMSEADRAARLELIKDQGNLLGQIEADRNSLRYQLDDLKRQFESVEADRAARLEVIKDQGNLLGQIEADRNSLRYQLDDLKRQLEASEADSAARLKVIESLTAHVQGKDGELKLLKEELRKVGNQLEKKLKEIEEMKISLSWKITAPFRWIYNKVILRGKH